MAKDHELGFARFSAAPLSFEQEPKPIGTPLDVLREALRVNPNASAEELLTALANADYGVGPDAGRVEARRLAREQKAGR